MSPNIINISGGAIVNVLPYVIR